MSRPVILLTGFEPFGGHAANPSEEVAKALDGRAVGGVVVRSAVLPVDHAAAGPRVAALIDELDPGAIVHLGLAAGRARITRYDAEAGTLEARVRRFLRPALIRLRAEADGPATRVRVESDALGWAPMFRRFRGGLLDVVKGAS